MQCFNTHLKVGVHGNRPTLSSALSVFECYQCSEQLSLFKQLPPPQPLSMNRFDVHLLSRGS